MMGFILLILLAGLLYSFLCACRLYSRSNYTSDRQALRTISFNLCVVLGTLLLIVAGATFVHFFQFRGPEAFTASTINLWQ